MSIDGDPSHQDAASTPGAGPSCPTKRKRREDDPEDDDDVIEISSDAVCEDDDSILEVGPPPKPRKGPKPLDIGNRGAPSVSSSEEEWNDPDSGEDDVWIYSHRPKRRRRSRTKSPTTVADLSDF